VYVCACVVCKREVERGCGVCVRVRVMVRASVGVRVRGEGQGQGCSLPCIHPKGSGCSSYSRCVAARCQHHRLAVCTHRGSGVELHLVRPRDREPSALTNRHLQFCLAVVWSNGEPSRYIDKGHRDSQSGARCCCDCTLVGGRQVECGGVVSHRECGRSQPFAHQLLVAGVDGTERPSVYDDISKATECMVGWVRVENARPSVYDDISKATECMVGWVRVENARPSVYDDISKVTECMV
jgi:hypothetical protein